MAIVNSIYELRRDNVLAECVDADERPLHQSQKLERGTELTILRGPHHWGNIKRLEYTTVQIGNKYFNVPARVLARSIVPKNR